MSQYTDRIYKVLTAEKPRNGSLLVSRPFLGDSNFTRSVILMVDCENSGQEALGVILNRKLDLGVNDAISGLDLPGNPGLYLGGPVGHDRLVLVHTLGSDIIPDSVALSNGLWVGGDFEAIKDYIRAGGETDGCIKLAVGYSGWGEGQLERELEEGTWAVCSLPAEDIMSPEGPEMWKKAVDALDGRYNLWKQLPLRAGLN